jgi:2-succinyl-5-enolpyruvyl-6-hydroxy-3-cyclohexene-1-carboxylate synthase
MPEHLSHAEVLSLYVGSFIDELAVAGVENICLCPGSRSTPLALAVEHHPDIKTWMHLDERSCAYFALGMAKASRKPIAILCSSGTAAVNFAPAVVEAFHSHVPLIVLTADRPPELQGLGANQTIDQVNLYGTAVKWFTNLPLPEASDHMLRYVRMIADRAVATAMEGARGPVHVNAPFREPLVPDPATLTAVRVSKPGKPASTASQTARFDDEASSQARRPLIVCGPESDLDKQDAASLAAGLGAPLLADPVSGLRGVDAPEVLGAYDGFLRHAELAAALQPDYILRFGAPPTSKPLATYLQLHRNVRQVQVASPGAWPDPDLTADSIVFADSAAICAQLASQGRCNADASWLTAWQQAESRTIAAICNSLASPDVSEPSAIVDLAAHLPAGATVIAGNSMPVRDIDSFFPANSHVGTILANRGASGIDGVVSTALGASAASARSTVLVIGDLSFYHDMNGLLAAKRFGLKATIVLINNDGGGIFSFLPQHEDAEHFETLWGTPHGLDFSHVAALYGVGFQRVTTREAYKAALKASFEMDGVQIVEIKTDREENLRLHQRIWDEIANAVADIVVPSPGGEG